VRIDVPNMPEGCRAVSIDQPVLGPTGHTLHRLTAICGDRGPVTIEADPTMEAAETNDKSLEAQENLALARKDLGELIAGMCIDCPNKKSKRARILKR